MAIRVQRHANVSKQATLLDGLDVSPLKWRVCGYVFNLFVHESMNHISNVKVHLKTRSGNVNMYQYDIFIFSVYLTRSPMSAKLRLSSCNLSSYLSSIFDGNALTN